LLLYYITDRRQFPGDESSRRRALLAKITESAKCGIDLIQLREKDLSTRELEELAHEAVRVVRGNSEPTRLLINSRTDVAIACGADGIHLRSEDVSPADVRLAWSAANSNPGKPPYVGVSCHTAEDVARAVQQGADFVVFAPVFEKKSVRDAAPAGLAALKDVCRQNIPVIALGGVTLANAQSCIEAGAAGVAGIRLFQENDIADILRKLRG